jgi:hypothetical protein
MRLSDLRHFEQFAGLKTVKVIRHRAKDRDLQAMVGTKQFARYQNGQSWDVFNKAEIIISFTAERHKYARFAGVWLVHGKGPNAHGGIQYRTSELPGFEDLIGRLVVAWGDGTRSWAQWFHRQGDKEVVEILPANYVRDFPGYYDVVLTYGELQKIVDSPDANREWHRMLSAVSGVYLILDTKSGDQYVGSAYGKGGLLQRWRQYAKSGHGGNQELVKLLEKHPNRKDRFQFSILRVLESSSMKSEVIAHECIAKEKLGSRVFGLNAN